jgi:short-subunit dehydrogenase
MKKQLTIAITGTTSGFGKGAAKELLKQGHLVYALQRGDQKRFESIWSDELKTYSGQLHFVSLDLENPQSVVAAATELKSKLSASKLDVLINNAGYGILGPTEDLSIEQTRRQFEINYFGLVELTRGLLPLLRNSKGTLINLSSVVGTATLPFYSQYAATKHAVEALTETLYYELSPFGVNVYLVEPGGFKTEFFNRASEFSPEVLSPKSAYFDYSNRFIKESNKRAPGLPTPEAVIAKLVQLSTQGSWRFRHPVGKDAMAMLFARRFLPDPIRVLMMRAAFRFLFF